MARRYTVVDVFTSEATLGNPVGVVLDAEGLDAAAMQRIAAWTNLSETTFVLPATDPQASYRLRIFTPRDELPFAGHPTLGSAHAVVRAGLATPKDGVLLQQCVVGLVRIERDGEGGDAYRLKLPPARLRSLEPEVLEEFEQALGATVDPGVAPALVDVGPVWLVARVSPVERLLGLRPDMGRLATLERRLGATGATLFAERAGGRDGLDVEVRSFAPSSGIDEDPVCGSGNGSVAVFRRERGLLPAGACAWEASQGRAIGRDGRARLEIEPDGTVWVGGTCVSGVEGQLRLD